MSFGRFQSLKYHFKRVLTLTKQLHFRKINLFGSFWNISANYKRYMVFLVGSVISKILVRSYCSGNDLCGVVPNKISPSLGQERYKEMSSCTSCQFPEAHL